MKKIFLLFLAFLLVLPLFSCNKKADEKPEDDTTDENYSYFVGKSTNDFFANEDDQLSSLKLDSELLSTLNVSASTVKCAYTIETTFKDTEAWTTTYNGTNKVNGGQVFEIIKTIKANDSSSYIRIPSDKANVTSLTPKTLYTPTKAYDNMVALEAGKFNVVFVEYKTAIAGFAPHRTGHF